MLILLLLIAHSVLVKAPGEEYTVFPKDCENKSEQGAIKTIKTPYGVVDCGKNELGALVPQKCGVQSTGGKPKTKEIGPGEMSKTFDVRCHVMLDSKCLQVRSQASQHSVYERVLPGEGSSNAKPKLLERVLTGVSGTSNAKPNTNPFTSFMEKLAGQAMASVCVADCNRGGLEDGWKWTTIDGKKFGVFCGPNKFADVIPTTCRFTNGLKQTLTLTAGSSDIIKVEGTGRHIRECLT